MAQRNIGSKVGYEPVPGYVLRKRLGAGGYGEVWLADAPGGLQKAVKLIYGTVDESHATSELRSLNRIRQVYHPFLLSIERIEVVANQVVIITELAEGSLLDCFEQFRRKGAPGIPRANLLEYMRDTADALDFLAQKHALQHLDVKPANLLMIADHIKVADFGLIKDLHDQNQSLVSGLTPTYSAPEMFDGRPDYRSDQYSLSIVYMEMLTSRLPFPGRTTGELALQHVNHAPNLDALPPADRPVVARALSKNPMDRFGTCRQFVEQLLKTRSAVVPTQVVPRVTAKDSGDSRLSSTMETQPSPGLAGRHVFRHAIRTEELERVWINPRALFIGLGGVGGQALVSLRQVANHDCDSRQGVADLGWLAIDTDAESLNRITSAEGDEAIPATSAIQLPIYKPAAYRNADPHRFGPLSRRWLYNIPRSLTTEGVRPLAILALLDHYQQLRGRLLAELRSLIDSQQRESENPQPLRIYLLASMHGGTGSGLLAEVGMLVRRCMAELRCHQYRLCAMLTAASTTNNHTANLPAAAAIACLSELQHWMHPPHDVPSLVYADQMEGLSSSRPFDWVTLFEGGMHGNGDELSRTLHDLASATWLDAQTMAGAALNESRLSRSNHRHGWLRSMASTPIRMTSNVSPQNLARWCCEETLHHGLRYMAEKCQSGASPAQSTTAPKTRDTLQGSTLSGDMPLTEKACQEFAQRVLLDLGFITADGPHPGSHQAANYPAASDQAEEERGRADKWACRLASEPRRSNAQLAEDVALWQHTIANTVNMRLYNWRQIERIQLRMIESLLDLCEGGLHELAIFLDSKWFAEKFPEATPPANRRQAAEGYIRRFCEICVQLLETCQREGQALGNRFNSWRNSIAAERSLNEAPWEVSLSGLPPRLQLLARRVNAVLETTLHRLASQIVDDAPIRMGFAAQARHIDRHEAANVNLNYMLSLSSDLVTRISKEIGIGDEEYSEICNAQGLSLSELEGFYPNLVASGAEIDRLVITPGEQHGVLTDVLEARKLIKNTTVITSTRSLGTHVLCDAAGFELRQVICALWRPSPGTLQLSERLRTRVDIDWEPAATLLESTAELLAESSLPSIPIAPVAMDAATCLAAVPSDS